MLGDDRVETESFGWLKHSLHSTVSDGEGLCFIHSWKGEGRGGEGMGLGINYKCEAFKRLQLALDECRGRP